MNNYWDDFFNAVKPTVDLFYNNANERPKAFYAVYLHARRFGLINLPISRLTAVNFPLTLRFSLPNDFKSWVIEDIVWIVEKELAEHCE